MKILFKNELTKPGQDGLGLLYDVDGLDLEIQISRTLIAMFNISAYNSKELFEQFRLESIINGIHDQFQGDKGPIEKIDLDSDGLKIKGKIYFSTEELKKFIIKKRWIINGEYWEIMPPGTTGKFNVVRTNIRPETVGGGAAKFEVVETFNSEEEAQSFLARKENS